MRHYPQAIDNGPRHIQLRGQKIHEMSGQESDPFDRIREGNAIGKENSRNDGSPVLNDQDFKTVKRSDSQ